MKKTFTIGIAGGSASGKTTFAENLAKSLSGKEVLTIHMDSYFKSEDQRPFSQALVTNKMYVDDNHPLSMDLPKMERDLTDTLSNSSYDIVIIEGLLTLWNKNIYDMLDLKLFVDCRADERIVRRLKRNMNWGIEFDQISAVYLDLVRYRHDEYVEPSKWRADFILNGSSPSDTALNLIVHYINSL